MITKLKTLKNTSTVEKRQPDYPLIITLVLYVIATILQSLSMS